MIDRVESSTSPHGLIELISQLCRQVSNWLTVALLMQLVLPSRWLPHPGLQRTPLGMRRITVRLRNGLVVECPIAQLYPLFETFVFPSYEVDGLASARTIIDIGAHIGWTSLWFATHAPQAEILAVEPDARWWKIFEKNMHANHFDRRVRLLPAAAAAVTGRVSLEIDPNTRLAQVRTGSAVDRDGVPALSLQDLFGKVASTRPVDVLKLDCEGAEYDILLSSSNEVLKQARIVIAEYHPIPGHDVEEIRGRFSAAGFTVNVNGDKRFGMLTARL